MNELVRIVDDLETRAADYVTLAEVERALGRSAQAAIDEGLLLVDYRQRVDARSGSLVPVTLCRLNRQHPLVRQLTAW
ncbi:MAG TPA: hypothetical protein VFG86_02890 [Chloroflexota bacterium]|nr:hypothetical protein [Chloroflexota bacterium]